MDYFKLLNMTKEPFSNSPDPAFFFQSEEHVKILQKLELAIRLRRGLNVVIGDVGTGKTTLCRQLIRRFDGDPIVETHLILDSHMNTPLEFLTTVAKLFGQTIPQSGGDEWQIKELIKQYLFQRGVEENKIVLLILDEGQNIPPFGLEILREFLNYETNEFKLLQIIVFAQTEFDEIIKDYPSFTDRINYYYELGPFTFEETRAMILFRLRQASKDGRLPVTFTYPAFHSVYRASGGFPRKIIHLCHKVMLALIIKNRTKADWALISACTRKEGPEAGKRRRWGLAAAALVVILVAFLLWQWIPGEQESVIPKIKPPLTARESKDSPPLFKGPLKTLKSEETPLPQASTLAAPLPAPVLEEKPKTQLPLPAAPEVKLGRLEEIRGAPHKDYWRIVFQFDDTIDIGQPAVQGREGIIRFKNVNTNMGNFIQFKTFPSWVRLKKVEKDLEVQIGLPENFKGLNHFFLKDPFRLVIDLH